MTERALTKRVGSTMAQRVLEHHFGKPAARIAAKGGGLSNLVFEADHHEGCFVVRIGRTQDKLNAYVKEQWTIQRVASAGVPVPSVLQVGNEIVAHPYMVSRKVVGEPATYHAKRGEILREMGRYARMIHSVRTNGFGETFDWSQNKLTRNRGWRDFLRRELAVDTRVRWLEQNRMLSKPQIGKLRKTLRGMSAWRQRPVLQHGDLRLKNVMVDKAGSIVAILDWEDAIGCGGPYWDLAIALHDLSIDEKHAFLAGYALNRRAVTTMAPALKALNAVNYVPALMEMFEARQRMQLDMYRLRLSGALDLYSF